MVDQDIRDGLVNVAVNSFGVELDIHTTVQRGDPAHAVPHGAICWKRKTKVARGLETWPTAADEGLVQTRDMQHDRSQGLTPTVPRKPKRWWRSMPTRFAFRLLSLTAHGAWDQCRFFVVHTSQVDTFIVDRALR